MGSAHKRPAAKGLLCQRAARCDVSGLAGAVRDLFWYYGGAGVRLGRWRQQLDGDRARPAGCVVGGSADVKMIRVALPFHLRNLAHAGNEVELDVSPPITQRSVLDALEARYPMLRGTIRDHGTQQRRAFLRFFACEEDLSHESPDAPLPEAVTSGKEPFLIIGAIAGG